MSRIARKPIAIKTGVDLQLVDRQLSIKGKHGAFVYVLHEAVDLCIEGQTLRVSAKGKPHPMVGTTFKLIQNMIHGVSELFNFELELVGVGYRAKIQGTHLELSLGYSNPVLFEVPVGVSVLVPVPTKIILQGINKQLLGKVAAEICECRPPESYKGKGIRRFGAVIPLKQTKKKK